MGGMLESSWGLVKDRKIWHTCHLLWSHDTEAMTFFHINGEYSTISYSDCAAGTLILSTHTHIQTFNGLFSRTTWVGRYQKETILDFAEARDDRVAVASAEPYANHFLLTPVKQPRQPSSLHHIFTGRMPFLQPNQQHQSTEGMYWYWVQMRITNDIHCSNFLMAYFVPNMPLESNQPTKPVTLITRIPTVSIMCCYLLFDIYCVLPPLLSSYIGLQFH